MQSPPRSKYRRMIEEFEDSRQSWIDILIKNPGSMQASTHILSINAKIELLTTLRILDGDYDE